MIIRGYNIVMIETDAVDIDTLEGRLSRADLRQVAGLIPNAHPNPDKQAHVEQLAREFSRSDEHRLVVARHLGEIVGLLHLYQPKTFLESSRIGYVRETLLRGDLIEDNRRMIQSRLLGAVAVAADESHTTLIADLNFPPSSRISLYTSNDFKRVDNKIHHLVRYPRKPPAHE